MLPTAGGFLLTVLADSVDAPTWVVALSPFDHLALVPGTPPNVPAARVMLTLAAAIGAVGVLSYRRRDIRGD